MTNSVAIRSLRAFCYRYPLQTPVETSFGRMLDRPAVFIRIEDEDPFRSGLLHSIIFLGAEAWPWPNVDLAAG